MRGPRMLIASGRMSPAPYHAPSPVSPLRCHSAGSVSSFIPSLSWTFAIAPEMLPGLAGIVVALKLVSDTLRFYSLAATSAQTPLPSRAPRDPAMPKDPSLLGVLSRPLLGGHLLVLLGPPSSPSVHTGPAHVLVGHDPLFRCLSCLPDWAPVRREGAFIPVFLAAGPAQCMSKMGMCLFSKCPQDRRGRVVAKREGQERGSLAQVQGDALQR